MGDFDFGFFQFIVPYVTLIVAFLEKFSFLGTSTHFVHISYLDNLLVPVSHQLGMDLTVIKYTLGIFIVYPFSFLLRLIPGKNLKHLLSCVGGIVLVQWVFGPDWVHAFVSSSVTYALCLIVPRKYCAHVVFAWVMGYMTVAHLYRMWVSYLTGVFDFTGTQMVLTMKLTSFAYNLYDGTYDKKNVFGIHEDKASSKVYASRKKYAIEKLPNILEYFGYVFCFTCILAGPAFEYKDYISTIDGSVFQDKSKKDQKSSAPSSLLPSLLKFSVGVFFLIGHVVGSGYFPMSKIYDPSFIASASFLYRYAFLYLALCASRCKYYFVWMMAEGGSNIGGFGFEGYDKEGRVIGWEGVKNIDIVGFESASCIQHLSRAWNKRTQGWLERYTYLRCGRSLLVTYFVSALWHGLYPGFFIFFMTVPFYTHFERLARTKINPRVAPGYDGYNYSTYPKTAVALGYWFLCWLFNTLVVNYTVQAFNYGSLERCLVALRSYYFSGHILCLLGILVLSVVPTPRSQLKNKSE